MNARHRHTRRLQWMLAFGVLLACRASQAQDQFVVGVANYLNRLFVPAPASTNAQLKSIAFFSGSVGSVTNVNTPHSGNVVLKVASFGQPVASAPFVAPDFFLGQQIIPPAGAVLTNAPTVDNTNRVFFVPGVNLLFASEAGFVRITWQLTNGTFLNKTYFISPAPGATTTPQSVYWTDGNSGNTGAPTIDFSGLNVVLHNNSSLPATAVFTSGNRLHARDNAGSMVLEYHDGVSNSFLGVQIINVKPYTPDRVASVDVGVFLSPAATSTNRVRALVTRGLADAPLHYAYQHSAVGDLHDGDIFITRPTTAPASAELVETNVEVFWRQTGFAWDPLESTCRHASLSIL